MELSRNLPYFLQNVKRAPNADIPTLTDCEEFICSVVPPTKLLSSDNASKLISSIKIIRKAQSPPLKGEFDAFLSIVNLIKEGKYTKNFLIKKACEVDGVVIYPRGTDLHPIMKRFMEILSNNGSELIHSSLQRLVALTISSKKKKKIVLSSDPFDIATMSMRGIKSCMSWSNAHSIKLEGSIVDPTAYVLYITDGANTNLGTRMLYRAVVRVVNKITAASATTPSSIETDNYSVYIDNLYTTTGNKIHIRTKSKVLEIIKEFLTRKIKELGSPKFNPVVECMGINDRYKFVIQAVPEVRDLPTYRKSYIDSGIRYIWRRKLNDGKMTNFYLNEY